MTITIDTITDRHIRDLRMAAQRAGAQELVEVCTVALWRKADLMFMNQPYRAHAEEGNRLRAEARARVVEIYNTTFLKLETR